MRVQGSACLGVTQYLVLSALSVLVRWLCSALMCCLPRPSSSTQVDCSTPLLLYVLHGLERATDLTDHHLFSLKDREADTEIFSEGLVLFFIM